MTNQPPTNSTPQSLTTTPNLMDLCLNEAWIREAAHAEAEVGCDIGAGYTGLYLQEFVSDPLYFQQMRQLQAIVLAAFRELLEQFNLGIGMGAAFDRGRQLVLERLEHPAVEIQTKLWSILEAHQASEEKNLPLVVKAEVKEILQNVLTQQDWQEIAAVAAESVRSQVLACVQR